MNNLMFIMRRKSFFSYIIAIFYLVAISRMVKAQTVSPQRMLPVEFDKWTTDEKSRSESQRLSLNGYSDMLSQRFSSGLYSTDDSIINIAIIHENYESSHVELRTNISQFKLTLQFIFNTIPKLYKRDSLVSDLHRIAADLYLLQGDKDKSAQELEESHRILNVIHVSVDKRRIESAVTLANLLSKKEDFKKSESLYLEALSYPWFKLHYDEESQQFLKNQYVRAGKGIVDLRSGDLTSLKRTYFLPATEDQLGTYLQTAIDRAQKEKERRDSIVKGATFK